jgi:aminoglycoside 2'-N-acetyltransferase I
VSQEARAGDVNVVVRATEELDDVCRDAIVELCVAAHESEEFRRLFTYFIPRGGRHALAYRGTDVVSHAVATTRWVQPAELPALRTAFVDAVSTSPEQQGRGYGSAVMRALASAMGDDEIGCLQTDRVGFYERLGWEPWRGPLGGRRPDGIVPTPEQRGVMILRLTRTPPLDLDASMTIECQPDRIWE